MNLSPEEQYIHAIATTLTGGKILFTANPFLLGCIHKAISIYVDTTFKHTAGEMNEWEIVMWDEEVQHGMLNLGTCWRYSTNLCNCLAVTVGCIYSNKANTLQYKTIFDQLQYTMLGISIYHISVVRCCIIMANWILTNGGMDL